MAKRFVRIETAAKYHQVHINTMRRWIEEGKVNAKKDPGGFRWQVEIEVEMVHPDNKIN